MTAHLSLASAAPAYPSNSSALVKQSRVDEDSIKEKTDNMVEKAEWIGK